VTRLTCSFAAIGFYGKIPARGDFVRAGLQRGFIDPWDGWLQHMLSESRLLLGESWLPAWLEAPVWRFRLQPGICGPLPASGVFMPSIDRAGRHFPLTLAGIGAAPNTACNEIEAWLDQAEQAGIAAIEHDLDPDTLLSRLQPEPAVTTASHDAPPAGACAWWTAGAPRVPATAFATDALPDPALFARMLQAEPIIQAAPSE
jgi:type VI secretion system protein ImpM